MPRRVLETNIRVTITAKDDNACDSVADYLADDINGRDFGDAEVSAVRISMPDKQRDEPRRRGR